MTDLEIAGVAYRIGRLDAFTQFHIARRLAPVQLAMGVAASDLASKASEDEASIAAAIMGPIADIVSKMPQDDVDYILKACLSVATRRQGDTYARVFVNNSMMFADVNMPVMMRITIAVIKENLGGFFEGLPGAMP